MGTQINKIMNERGEITTNTKEIQTIIRAYYEQLYTSKFDNLEEMDAFLKTCKLPKLHQEKENLNNPEPVRILKQSSKISQQTRAQGQMASQEILPNIQRRINICSPETIPKNKNGRKTSKLIL